MALKMGQKNVNPCLAGLKMEDEDVQSPQTFLARKYDDR